MGAARSGEAAHKRMSSTASSCQLGLQVGPSAVIALALASLTHSPRAVAPQGEKHAACQGPCIAHAEFSSRLTQTLSPFLLTLSTGINLKLSTKAVVVELDGQGISPSQAGVGKRAGGKLSAFKRLFTSQSRKDCREARLETPFMRHRASLVRRGEVRQAPSRAHNPPCHPPSCHAPATAVH